MPSPLNYDELVFLDAEELAEQGMRRAYERVLPILKKHVQQPVMIEEIIDDEVGSYSIKYRQKEFVIYRSGNDYRSWTNATYAFFAIVNDQLAHMAYRFYAINGGNDLGGMFLTADQVEAARRALPEKRDWPYIPTNEPPTYGKYW
jgi:hypothetical protein